MIQGYQPNKSTGEFKSPVGLKSGVPSKNSNNELLDSLETMIALCRLKFGNLDEVVYKEIIKAEALITKYRRN